MNKKHNLTAQLLLFGSSLLLLVGCSTPSAISEKVSKFESPTKWSSETLNSPEQLNVDWLGISAEPRLQQLLKQALQNNFELANSKLAIAKAQALVEIEQSSDFPELSLDVSQQRRKLVTDGSSSYSSSAGIDLNLSYEVDLWGKLSAEQQQAQLQLAATKSNYQHQKVSLMANITSGWFDVLEAESLLSLYQGRLQNLEDNLAIIQGSYRLGLKSALDVYLTQNELHSEQARVKRQQQTIVEVKRALQVQMAEYPSGISPLLDTQKQWPQLNQQLYANLPSDLIANRRDLQASWLELLALNAGLAVAHKQRFPQFTLSASLGDASDELGNLLSGNSLAWSLLGNISSPIFNAGRLAANEQQAKISVQQKEQQYLSELYNAFSQVESQLNNHVSLSEQLSLQQKAQINALAAEKLAFNQYQKGLVTYTTVLESQRRAFDNQTATIQLKNQLIQNRIAIYLATGGQVFNESLIQSTGQ